MADVLEVLMAERDRLDRAIAIMQGAAPRRGRPPGRRGPGRPPGSGRKKSAAKAARNRRGMSATARKAASVRMKKYWAAKKKTGKKAVKKSS